MQIQSVSHHRIPVSDLKIPNYMHLSIVSPSYMGIAEDLTRYLHCQISHS